MEHGLGKITDYVRERFDGKDPDKYSEFINQFETGVFTLDIPIHKQCYVLMSLLERTPKNVCSTIRLGIRLGYDSRIRRIRRGYDADTTDTTLLCFKGVRKLNGHVLKCPERYPLRFQESSWNLQNVGVPGNRESPEGPPAARAGSGVPRDKRCGLVPAHLASLPATGPRAHTPRY